MPTSSFKWPGAIQPKKATVQSTYCLSFDGTNDYVEVVSPTGLPNIEDEKSISFWTQWDGTTDVRVLVSLVKDNTSGANNAVYVRIFEVVGGFAAVQVTNWGNADSLAHAFFDTAGVDADDWFHVVVVNLPGGTKVYINGVDCTNPAVGTSSQTGTVGVVRIGSFNNAFPTPYHNRPIDDVAIFDRVLTATEAKYLATGTLDVAELGPVALWRLEEGTGTDAYDTAPRTPPGSPVLVLAADEIEGLEDGDPVVTWSDTSGSGFHATAITDEPTYQTDELNGRSVVRFDGTNDDMRSVVTGLGATRTICILAKKQSSPSGANDTLLGTGDADTGTLAFTNSGTSASAWLYYANSGGGVETLGGDATDWSILSYVYTDASDVEVFIDGASAGSFDPNNSYDANDNLTLGAQPAGTNHGDYDIAEVVVYDSALSSDDREEVEDYLRAKWLSNTGTISGATWSSSVAAPLELEYRVNGGWPGAIQPEDAGGGITENMGLVTETDTSFGFTHSKSKSIGLNSETGTPLSIMPYSLYTVGIVSETDSSLGMAHTKSRSVGLTTETDTALALQNSIQQSMGLVSETDTSLGMAHTKLRAIGLNTEADTALSLAGNIQQALGLVTETDTSQGISRTKNKSLGLNSETDASMALTTTKTRSVGLNTEIDTCLVMAHTKTKTIGINTETDTSLSLSRLKSLGLGQSVETDSSLSFTHSKLKAMGLCVETDSAIHIAAPHTLIIGLTTEADTCLHLTISILGVKTIREPALRAGLTRPPLEASTTQPTLKARIGRRSS